MLTMQHQTQQSTLTTPHPAQPTMLAEFLEREQLLEINQKMIAILFPIRNIMEISHLMGRNKKPIQTTKQHIV